MGAIAWQSTPAQSSHILLSMVLGSLPRLIMLIASRNISRMTCQSLRKMLISSWGVAVACAWNEGRRDFATRSAVMGMVPLWYLKNSCWNILISALAFVLCRSSLKELQRNYSHISIATAFLVSSYAATHAGVMS